MDLIYTNSKRIDQGVLGAYAFDLSFGVSENDFELTLGENESALDFGAFVYIESTEYGGIVDGIKVSTTGNTITYYGRTWHGVLEYKVIQPDTGADYYTVSGNAHEVLRTLVNRLGVGEMFTVKDGDSLVTIKNYQFHRYVKGYTGVKDMVAANGGKLKMQWKNRAVELSVEPIVDYTKSPVDGDVAALKVEQYRNKTNHLICLGKGDLAEREVIHLFVDQFGRVGDVQYYTGIDEICEAYDYANSSDLRGDGVKKLKELLASDKAEISIPQTADLTFDIGDIVGASEIRSGVSVAAEVTQKIIKINNGKVTVDYKTGG